MTGIRAFTEREESCTFRLIKEPLTVFSGLSAIIDLKSDVVEAFNLDETDTEADSNALACDWQAVGGDLYAALDNYAEETRR